MIFNDEQVLIRQALRDSMQTFDAQGDHLSASQCDEALTILESIITRQIALHTRAMSAPCACDKRHGGCANEKPDTRRDDGGFA